MADPGMEQAARAASEEAARAARNRQNDEEAVERNSSFAAQDRSFRRTNALYGDRRSILRDVRALFRERQGYLDDIERCEYDADRAQKRFEQHWVDIDGNDMAVSYSDIIDLFRDAGISKRDEEVLNSVQNTLDKHPSAISAAQKAGFSFVNQDEFDLDDLNGNLERAREKELQFTFLQNCINAYNKGSYQPYYDRKYAYAAIKKNEDNPNVPFGRLKKSKNDKEFDEFFKSVADRYGVDRDTVEQWYQQADRVILSFERNDVLNPEASKDPNHGKIDVDYESLHRFAVGCATIQHNTNLNGIEIENVFDVVTRSSNAHEDYNEAVNRSTRLSYKLYDCERRIEEDRKLLDTKRKDLYAEYGNRPSTGSALQQMYDREMGRYRDGFTQQPPRMWDIVNRWAHGKTRFLDSRRESKEQMREQKWMAKTGINERGIKTNGGLGDWLKSIVNEVRRGVAMSGVTDFTLFGDAERVAIALGMDGTRNMVDKVRMGLTRVSDYGINRFLKKHTVTPHAEDEASAGFDTANFTRSLQISSEAETKQLLTGDEEAAKDYDGRDNNPADVMAGWDEYNEKGNNLQRLLDDKGYHNQDEDDPDFDGPDEPDLE